MRKPARRTALLARTASDRIAGALARIKTQPRPKRPETRFCATAANFLTDWSIPMKTNVNTTGEGLSRAEIFDALLTARNESHYSATMAKADFESLRALFKAIGTLAKAGDLAGVRIIAADGARCAKKMAKDQASDRDYMNEKLEELAPLTIFDREH